MSLLLSEEHREPEVESFLGVTKCKYIRKFRGLKASCTSHCGKAYFNTAHTSKTPLFQLSLMAQLCELSCDYHQYKQGYAFNLGKCHCQSQRSMLHT